jgi:hypothetical protein
MQPGKSRRKNARVKLPIRHAHELEATLHNVREFCGMHGAGEELMSHIRSCEQNVKRAVADRDRVIGKSD